MIIKKNTLKAGDELALASTYAATAAAAGISSTWDFAGAEGGTLELSSSAAVTKAQFRDALRQVTFFSIAESTGEVQTTAK